MADGNKKPATPGTEDLGRGGDAAVSFPAGTPGEREEISEGLAERPDVSGPRRPPEPELPAPARQ